MESLRRDIRQLQLEHDILKKANELIKKGTGIDPQLLSNREKAMLVDVLTQSYSFPELLAALEPAVPTSITVHVSSLLTGMLTRVASSRVSRCYGYRRIH